LACLELRIAAFRRLNDPALRAFLGVTASATRRETYVRLRSGLGESARAFWDAHPDAIAQGIIHAGKFERYLRAFRRFLLPLIHPRRTIEQLRKPRSPAERERFYDERWDTWRWRCLFRLFFSRAVMGRLGRDPAFFAHVEGEVGSRILARTRHALAVLPAHSNPYLAYIATGTFPLDALPRYLRPEHTGAVRERLDRLRIIHGTVPEACDGRFDGFNLSDIFEYMSPAEHERCYAALLDRANPGARLVYWNMLAPRACPGFARDRVRPLEGAASRLHAQDQAWFYQSFHVDEVVGEDTAGGA
jgi:S-adenosylmethionine-diacylglycerol 3-amino-3-carboxypropyl transferase